MIRGTALNFGLLASKFELRTFNGMVVFPMWSHKATKCRQIGD
jgi:hypothetical protein